MPKLIKKRVEKPEELQTEEEVKSFLSSLQRKAAARRRDVTIAAIVVAVIIVTVAGTFYYKRSRAEDANAHEYAGYKLYYGLYDKQGGAKSQRLAMALDEFKKAAEVRKTPATLYYIGSTYFSMGKYPEAIEALNAMVAAFPADREFVPLARYRIATAKEFMGKNEEALTDLNALSSGSGSLQDLALAESAQLLIKLGRQNEAKAKYEAILRQFPGSAYSDVAEAYIKRSNGISNSPAASAPTANTKAPAQTKK